MLLSPTSISKQFYLYMLSMSINEVCYRLIAPVEYYGTSVSGRIFHETTIIP